MGKKIQNAFEKIMVIAGLGERMSVSIKSGIPSVKASTIEDNYKNLTLMKEAVNTVFDNLPNREIKAKKYEILRLLD